MKAIPLQLYKRFEFDLNAESKILDRKLCQQLVDRCLNKFETVKYASLEVYFCMLMWLSQMKELHLHLYKARQGIVTNI